MIRAAAGRNPPPFAARCLAWLALLAVVAGVLALVLQRVADYRDHAGELAMLRERLGAVQTQRADPRPIEAALAALRAAPVASAGYIDAPDQSQAAMTFEQTVTGLATAEQIQLNLLQRLPAIPDGPAVAVRLQIGATLASGLVQPLIRDLERNPTSIVIDAVNIEHGAEGAVDLKLTLRAFWVAPS